jgi:predicted kinase
MINGPSCSGKSTIVKRIITEKEKFYQLSYDGQKWFFSKYDRDTHFKDVRSIVLALAKTVCQMKYNIVCDSALYRDHRQTLLRIPKKYGYEIIEINLEADYDIVVGRFDKRVADTLLNSNARVSNRSKIRFKELYDIYQAEKNPLAKSFRIDGKHDDEVAESILRMI